MLDCPAARASLQLLKNAESPPLPLEAASAGLAPRASASPAATVAAAAAAAAVQVAVKGRVMGPPTDAGGLVRVLTLKHHHSGKCPNSDQFAQPEKCGAHFSARQS